MLHVATILNRQMKRGDTKKAYGKVFDRLPPSLFVYTAVIHDKVCRQNATCKQQEFNH